MHTMTNTEVEHAAEEFRVQRLLAVLDALDAMTPKERAEVQTRLTILQRLSSANTEPKT